MADFPPRDAPRVTSDGSPVDLYLLLPPGRDPDVVDAAVPPGSDVLDLGSGVGRIAVPLAERGHRVLAVDDSAAMLGHVPRLDRIETLHARIEEVRLDRTFGGVLLASHLLNQPAADTRRALLATAAHHLAEGGRLVVQWHPPAWFDTVAEGGGRLGSVDVRLTDLVRDGELLAATVRYAAGERRWTHAFTARRLSEPDLHAELAVAGLGFDAWLTEDRTWFAAARRGA